MTLAEQTESSRKVINAFYDAVLSGDIVKVKSFMAADIVVHEPSYLPWRGDYHTPDALDTLLPQVGIKLDFAGLKIDLIVADGDCVIAILRVPDRTTGQHAVIAERSMIVGGKIAEVFLYYSDTQSIDVSRLM